MHDPETYERSRTSNGLDQIVDAYFPLVVNLMDWEKVKKGNVLDYGCGAGSVGYRHILPKVLETDSVLYSVDISEKMLDYANKNYKHDRIKYSIGNIMGEFPLKNVKFDKILACNVFNFIADLRTALIGLHSILKEKGQLGFVCPVTTAGILDALKQLQNSETFKDYMKGYDKFYPIWCIPKYGTDSKEVLERLLKEEGFSVSFLEIKSLQLPVNLDMLTGFTLSLNPCMDQVPEEMKRKMKEEVVDILRKLQGLTKTEAMEEKMFNFSFDYMMCLADKQSMFSSV